MEQNNQHDESRNPKHWRGGLLYFNPLDPRTFVPKRNPILGITLNFAKPQAYFIVLVVIAFITTLYKLSSLYGKG